jgi:hypothetical protein
MVKKLSKTGRTKFEIDNLDYGFIHEAIDNYKKHIISSEFPERSIMTKGFVLDRIDNLKKSLTVEKL